MMGGGGKMNFRLFCFKRAVPTDHLVLGVAAGRRAVSTGAPRRAAGSPLGLMLAFGISATHDYGRRFCFGGNLVCPALKLLYPSYDSPWEVWVSGPRAPLQGKSHPEEKSPKDAFRRRSNAPFLTEPFLGEGEDGPSVSFEGQH